MNLNHLRVTVGAGVLLAVSLAAPSVAVAEKKPPATTAGLSVASSTVTVGPGRTTPVEDPCTSFHGYPQCGTVSVVLTVAGFSGYLGLNGMESLGLATGPVENAGDVSGWGHVTGSAKVSGTALCTTTGRSFKFTQPVTLGYFWSDYADTVLTPGTRVNDDSARFVLLGGWDPRTLLPSGACPAQSDGSGVVLTYLNAQVTDVVVAFDSWQSPIPSTTFPIKGNFRMP